MKEDWTILRAAQKGNMNMVTTLLEHDANVGEKNDDTWTALHRAANNNRISVAYSLLAAGADIDETNIWKEPILTRAVRSADLVQALLLRGVFYAVDMFGRSALHFATLNGHVEVMRILEEAKRIDGDA